jgi:hypothetical protein
VWPSRSEVVVVVKHPEVGSVVGVGHLLLDDLRGAAMEVLSKCLRECARADDCAAEGEEGEIDLVVSFPSRREPAHSAEPGEGALDRLPLASARVSLASGVGLVSLGDSRLVAALADAGAHSAGVVTAVGEQQPRLERVGCQTLSQLAIIAICRRNRVLTPQTDHAETLRSWPSDRSAPPAPQRAHLSVLGAAPCGGPARRASGVYALRARGSMD